MLRYAGRLYGCLLALLMQAAGGQALQLPRSLPNDNRAIAGRYDQGQFLLDLELRRTTWYPSADDGRSIEAGAFAERGKPPLIPGPLIRVRAGTPVRVQLRNTLGDTIYVFGLHSRPTAAEPPPIMLLPGEQQSVSFHAGQPGTYYYWATALPEQRFARRPQDSQLNGALIIDPATGAVPADRIFVMSIAPQPPTPAGRPRVVMAINGKSFPHTERTEYTQHDTIRWRVINPTRAPHPMHMHGFYYTIEAQGNNLGDTLYAAADQRAVVTEHMRSGSTMSIRFVPHEPGFWAFHCHFAFHSGGHLGLQPHEEYGDPAHTPHEMSGLVLVYFIKPVPTKAAAAPPPAKPVRLLVRESADTTQLAQRMAYQLDSAPDTAFALPSSPLILRKGERTAITIVNRLREPTQVHWHGIELESYPDGIAGISGMPGRITPAIAPRDSFTAVFAPPRAGTFIYHAHMNDGYQINLGLYGALLVLDPGAVWDPERDHLIVVGGGGRISRTHALGLVNGTIAPPPIRMRVGETHRFRLISIHPEAQLQFSLVDAGGRVLDWLAVAKDGADLPGAQRKVVPAYWLSGPGETADYEFMPRRPGRYRLNIMAEDAGVLGWYMSIPVIVR